MLPLELRVKAWRVIGDSPIELENVINKDRSMSQRMQNRHLVIRAKGPACPQDGLGDLP